MVILCGMEQRRIDPNALMYWTDGYEQLPKATIGGKRLHRVAYQMERPKRYFGVKRRIKNIVYLIDGEKMVVYANREHAVCVMKMGLSLKRLRRYSHSRQRVFHPKCVTAEEYYERFSRPYQNQNEEWLKRNNYVLP